MLFLRRFIASESKVFDEVHGQLKIPRDGNGNLMDISSARDVARLRGVAS